MSEEQREPTRIALIIGQLTVGGAENQLRGLIGRLNRQRFDPIVYCLANSGGDVLSSLESDGVSVRIVGRVGLERTRRLAQALLADRVELVHSWLFIANTYAWAARWWGVRAPLVTSARNCKSQGWGHNLSNVAAFRASARIIANSRQVASYIVHRYRAPKRRIAVVYNGVDTQRFQPSGERPPGPPVIVTTGRFVTQKNPQLFVDAAAEVRRVVPEVRFVMIGDGPLRETIAERIRALGLSDAVELAGERPDVECLLNRANVFWLTSSWEGLPNVVMEAMACGLPVVATDVGGTRELITDGREGFLARPGRAEDFVRFGVELVRDPARRARMGEAARKKALQFSMTRMAAETESVYATALGRPV